MQKSVKKKSVFFQKNSQLLIPIIAILIIAVFNLFRDPSFFSIDMVVNNQGNKVLQGNLISILSNASELVILALGMTLVTASSGGQDISVGCQAAIAGSAFVKVLKSAGTITPWTFILGLFVAIIVTMIFASLNGTLVAIFKIQPMIATLILFTCGRSIAYWINGGATPTISSPILTAMGSFIPGCPIPTPILIEIVIGIIFIVIFKTTTLGLYVQTVGINQGAAKLNGINPIRMKLVSFIILGACCAIAGSIGVARLGLINHETLMYGIEMDAILAVAIGGNSLGGGKFNIVGSVLGAIAIQALTVTLYAMKVPSTDIQAYKAIVIIVLVVCGSPVVKEAFQKLKKKGLKVKRMAAGKEAV